MYKRLLQLVYLGYWHGVGWPFLLTTLFLPVWKKIFSSELFLPKGQMKLSPDSSRMQHEFAFPLGSHGWLSLVALCWVDVAWLASVHGGAAGPVCARCSSRRRCAVIPSAPFQPAAGQSGRAWRLFLVTRASCLPIRPLELPEHFLQAGWTSWWNLFWQLIRDCHRCSSKSSVVAYCTAAGVALSRILQNLDGLVCLCLNCIDF